MNVFETMTNRKQIRKFKPDPIDDKMIGVALHMATQAYSAGNVQEWYYIVVRDNGLKQKLFEAALKQDFVKDAPVDIIACADIRKIGEKYGKRGEIVYSIQDTAYATQNLLLALEGLGLGSYLLQSFNEDKVKDILTLPENIRPVAIISVGYPDESPEKLYRIPFENLTWVDEWGKKYEISFIVQPGSKTDIKPIGNRIKDVIEKYGKEEKPSKNRLSEFLKKIIS
jgi:nitroreductase